jgi:hypothetical protein
LDGLSNASINRELSTLNRIFALSCPTKIPIKPHIPTLKEDSPCKGFLNPLTFGSSIPSFLLTFDLWHGSDMKLAVNQNWGGNYFSTLLFIIKIAFRYSRYALLRSKPFQQPYENPFLRTWSKILKHFLTIECLRILVTENFCSLEKNSLFRSFNYG